MAELTERRKADRAKMAAAVQALAVEMGAAAEIVVRPYGDMSPQMIVTKIRTDRGLCLNVDFDGESCQPDVHVLSWHMAHDVDTCLADAFGSVNPHHFHKSTDVARGLPQLLDVLRRRLAMCADGSAYSPEREARQIAKNGTAADRAARFAEYVAEMKANAA